MIAPRIVSHVQPTPHDYSDRTSPDLITTVPGASTLEPRFPKGTPEYEAYATELREELRKWSNHEPPYDSEAGRVTLGNVLFWAALMAGGLLFAALTMLGGQAQ